MTRKKIITFVSGTWDSQEAYRDDLNDRMAESKKQGELSKAEKPKSPTTVLETGTTASNSTEQGITGSSKETSEK